MVSEVFAAVGAGKALFDTLAELGAAKKEAERAIIQAKAQREVMELVDTCRRQQEALQKLKAEIAAHDDWEEIKKKYELKPVSTNPDTLLYAKRQDDNSEEPGHWACPKCFGDKRHSILQGKQRGPSNLIDFKWCPSCETHYEMTKEKPFQPPPVKSSNWRT